VDFKKRRVSLNLSQKDVAEKLFVKRSTVAMWETGAAKPRADKLPALAKLLHCTVDQLLED
jgi:transcriptional regulator with XRE-family HTH domain